MSGRRVVVVLGGNAFVSEGGPLTMAGQFAFAEAVLAKLLPLARPPIELVLSHGNGPQVGHMLSRAEKALGESYALPLEVCVAESEGELGYVLLQSLRNVLGAGDVRRPVASLLTEVRVDADDPAFAHPEKPIGPVYAEDRARELRAQGFALVHEPGRGHRRVVPSPEPREILDLEVIELLLERGVLVVAAGGGGIPVVREGGRQRGVEAVIDKDLSAALLAERLGAEMLLIVTGVPCAYLDYGRPAQRPLARVTPSEVRRLAAQGHFPPGNMGPKLEAAARFASRPGRRAVVCAPSNLTESLAGRAGTLVALEPA